MMRFRKRLLAGALASAVVLAAGAGPADAASEEVAARLDALHEELADPGLEDWTRVEGEIVRLWSQSGSPAMDFLLRRGGEAMEAQDYASAIEHLSALIDHAPDFAEAFNARATAFFYLGEYSLSLSDIERTLALNPRHFGALEGLAAILEDLGESELAFEALQAAEAIHPNRPSVKTGLERLERQTGAAEL